MRAAARALTLAAIALTALAQGAQIRSGAGTSFVVTDLAVSIAFIVGGLGAWRLAARPALGSVSMLGAIAWQFGTLAMVTVDEPVTFLFFASSGYHDVAVAVLLLTYPSGLLVGRVARLVIVSMLVGYGVGSIARLTMFQPAAWGCDNCPNNPLALIDDESMFVATQDWIGRWLGVAVGIVALITALRWVRRSLPARRAAGILPFAGATWALLYVQDTWLRPADALLIDDPAAFYVLAVARASVPIGVLAGLTWMRLRQSRLAELFNSLGDTPRRNEIEPVLRSALHDPGLELWWRVDGTESFARAEAPDEHRTEVEPDRHEVVTVLHGTDQEVIGLLCHDAVLLDDDRFAGAVRSAVGLIGDHDRLTARVRDQLTEVRASRARILAAAAAERTRLERDLHDGSQQRLVGLALQLRMARGIVDDQAAPELAATLDLATKELAEAIADLRELARGIHPVALTDGGLRAALPLLADRTPIPATIDIRIAERLSATTESTLYFVASEALANLAKHSDASSCTVELRVIDDAAVLTVTDDGDGGAEEVVGGGLHGLRDRVEALGGSLRVSSRPGHGTTLAASIPITEDIASDA